MNIPDLIYKTLETVPLVFQSWYRKDLEDTHVIFQQIEEKPLYYTEGSYDEVEHIVQIDVFGKNEQEVYEIKELVKELMEVAEFDWLGTQYEHIEELSYYHVGHKFKYSEEL